MAIIWNLPLDHSQNEFKGEKKKRKNSFQAMLPTA